jgi:hypothetical protein
MTVALHYVSYSRKKESKKFVLQCQPWNPNGSLAGLDVTEVFNTRLKEDHKRGYDPFKGPAFGNEVFTILKAGRNHSEISHKWYLSSKSQDTDFEGFVLSYMRNAKSSTAFYEEIASLRRSMKMPEKNITEVDHVDILDFRPKINYGKGVWKNYKPEYFKIEKTWEYGATLNP